LEEIPDKQTAESSVLDTEENFISCEVCKKFSPRNLSEHTSASGTGTVSRCEECVTAITHEPTSVRRFGGAERMFTCHVCKKNFSRRRILITHIRLHSGGRPFSCEVCEKTFTSLFVLKRHLRRHNIIRAKHVRKSSVFSIV
jgi:KRAB domain-containing zinc finger protein